MYLWILSKGWMRHLLVCTVLWATKSTSTTKTQPAVLSRSHTAEPSTSSTHSYREPSKTGRTCPSKSLRPRPLTHLRQGPQDCSNPKHFSFLFSFRCWLRKVTKLSTRWLQSLHRKRRKRRKKRTVLGAGQTHFGLWHHENLVMYKTPHHARLSGL